MSKLMELLDVCDYDPGASPGNHFHGIPDTEVTVQLARKTPTTHFSTLCVCGGRKNRLRDVCRRCELAAKHEDKEWAMSVCLRCKSREAEVRNGVRLIRCEGCRAEELVRYKSRRSNPSVCSSCGGKYGVKLEDNALCAHCKEKVYAAIYLNQRIRRARKLNKTVKDYCRDLIILNEEVELAQALLRVLDEYQGR